MRFRDPRRPILICADGAEENEVSVAATIEDPERVAEGMRFFAGTVPPWFYWNRHNVARQYGIDETCCQSFCASVIPILPSLQLFHEVQRRKRAKVPLVPLCPIGSWARGRRPPMPMLT